MPNRTQPYNGRVAHVSLKGQVNAAHFTEGMTKQVHAPVTPLLDDPMGGQVRELIFGETFRVLDQPGDHAFGIRELDGYCGYVTKDSLSDPMIPTHMVGVRQTYVKEVPDLKFRCEISPLYFGSRVTVSGYEGDWARITVKSAKTFGVDRYLPRQHIRPVDDLERDPVKVARRFLGTPYLWGGNSAAGIDCSGLIQACMMACGIACQADSDQQASTLGQPIDSSVPELPGDVYFWEGHVGILGDPYTLIHATAYHMSVVEEPLIDVRTRVEGAGHRLIARRRLM